MKRTSRPAGLLALAVAFSAGIHAALAPEHLQQMPRLGYAFIAAAAIGGVLACALVTFPDDRRISLLAGLFCFGEIAAWALFVSVPVPGFSGTPEEIETIALVSKATELAGVALAFAHAPPRLRQPASVTSACRCRNSVDLIISTASLHHWNDVGAAIASLNRVLLPEGRMWIYDFRWVPTGRHARCHCGQGRRVDRALVRTGMVPRRAFPAARDRAGDEEAVICEPQVLIERARSASNRAGSGSSLVPMTPALDHNCRATRHRSGTEHVKEDRIDGEGQPRREAQPLR